jgi:hypothetical protein
MSLLEPEFPVSSGPGRPEGLLHHGLPWIHTRRLAHPQAKPLLQFAKMFPPCLRTCRYADNRDVTDVSEARVFPPDVD